MQIIKAISPPLCLALVGALYILVMARLSASFVMVCIIGGALVVFGLADAFGRFRDYLRVKAEYDKEDYIRIKLVNYYGHSYCGRHVVKTVDPRTSVYYRIVGYRWYHVLPDGFPLVLFRRVFWRNLFFGHRV